MNDHREREWITEAEAIAAKEGLAVADRPASEARKVAKIPLSADPVTLASMVGDQVREEPLFLRQDRVVVEMLPDGKLEEMPPARFVTWAGRRCFLYKRGREGEPVRAGMTQEAAKIILASEELRSRLRPIRRVVPVRIPVMDDDGTVRLAAPGYDAQSGIVVLDHVKFDEDWDVERAATWIRGFVKDFPWGDDGRSLAVWVASVMSVYCQALVPGLAPMFVFLANRPGSGKTVLAKIAEAVVYGRAGVLPWERDSTKLSEQLNSASVHNAPCMILDNVKGYVSSEALEAFLTSRVWTFRRFHSQTMRECEKNTVVFLSGNDATLSDDLIRRSLMVDLFADEDADERAGARDSEEIDDEVLARMDVRRNFLAAMWAIVRHWTEKGKPSAPTKFPSYQAWADVVAGMVAAAGFENPLTRANMDSGGDRSRTEFRELMEAAIAAFPEDAARGLLELPLSEWAALARGLGVYHEVLGTTDQAHTHMVEKRLFRWEENEMPGLEGEMRQAARWMDKSASTKLGNIFHRNRGQKITLSDGRKWQFDERKSGNARIKTLRCVSAESSRDEKPF